MGGVRGNPWPWVGESGCVTASLEGTKEDILRTWVPPIDWGREEEGMREERAETVQCLI